MNLGLPYPPVSQQIGCILKAIGSVAIVLGVAFTIAMITDSALWMEAGFRLCFGWVHRLWQTVPEITITPSSVANGTGALLLGSFVLHFTLATMSRHFNSRPAWRIRWSASLVAGLMLLFGICMSASGIGVHLKLLFQEPIAQPSLQREEFNDFRTARTLAAAFRWSDVEPGFTRAKNWHELASRYKDGLRPLEDLALLKASARVDVPEVWTFLEHAGDPELEATLVFCAPRAYSKEGRLAIFSDGEVKRCTPREFEVAMTNWRFARAKDLHASPMATEGSSP